MHRLDFFVYLNRPQQSIKTLKTKVWLRRLIQLTLGTLYSIVLCKLNVEPNTTMQEVRAKIQEQGALEFFQVSLSMVKNSCKCEHDLSHYHW